MRPMCAQSKTLWLSCVGAFFRQQASNQRLRDQDQRHCDVISSTPHAVTPWHPHHQTQERQRIAYRLLFADTHENAYFTPDGIPPCLTASANSRLGLFNRFKPSNKRDAGHRLTTISVDTTEIVQVPRPCSSSADTLHIHSISTIQNDDMDLSEQKP